MDIVGYSKLLTDRQRELLNTLNKIVRETKHFQQAEAAKKLIRLPTGDGMALAFFTNPETPLLCAIEISKRVKDHPDLPLRIGLHSGPVSGVKDVNNRSNVAGAGINLAQRVMDCGDAGHILLSQRLADDLGQFARWEPHLHPLGEVEVKHGLKIPVVNFYTDLVGTSAIPEKLKRATAERSAGEKRTTVAHRQRIAVLLLALTAALAIGAAFFLHSYRVAPKLTAGETIPIPERSIAVLPFQNLSAEKDDAYFADGIQDDVLTSLGKIKDLTVIARASVMTYRSEAAAGKLREIGTMLRVAHVLQGSVRRAADQVVINVQLVDTRDDRQIWAERYERTLTNTLSLQGEVALEIAHQLQATLTPGERSVVATKPTENPAAYLFYLRAREMELRLLTSEIDPKEIVKLYQQAIDLDPKFALARARLSIRLSFVSSGTDSDPIQSARALAEAREASRLRPEMGEARLALGTYYWSANDSDRALAELTEAEKMLPNSSEVWQIRATVYRKQNKIGERIAALRRAETLDPRDTNVLRMLAMTLRDVRDWPEAELTGERVRAVLHNSQRHGIYARAWDEVRRTGKLDPLKQELAQPPSGSEGDSRELHLAFQFELAMLERDFDNAQRLLHELPESAFEGEPHLKTMREALLAVARGGDRVDIERKLLAAREEIEKASVASSSDYYAYINLGLIDAFLGRKDEAIREGRRAVKIAAAASALEKNDASAGLALIYARTGEADLALQLIEHLLTLPADLTQDVVYNMTVTELKFRWEWDPLRSDPRFQKIITSPEPKTNYQ